MACSATPETCHHSLDPRKSNPKQDESRGKKVDYLIEI
jgi:hypothetical protein